MAEIPIREIGVKTYGPTAQWIASQIFQSQTFQMMDPGDIDADERGRMIVPSGTPYPANDATCFGLIINDANVAPGSVEVAVMLSGMVYEEKLPEDLTLAAQTALAGKIIPRNGLWNV